MKVILCWLLGHKRLWPTMPDGTGEYFFMWVQQISMRTVPAKDRAIVVHLCKRCRGLYWEPVTHETVKSMNPTTEVEIGKTVFAEREFT